MYIIYIIYVIIVRVYLNKILTHFLVIQKENNSSNNKGTGLSASTGRCVDDESVPNRKDRVHPSLLSLYTCGIGLCLT